MPIANELAKLKEGTATQSAAIKRRIFMIKPHLLSHDLINNKIPRLIPYYPQINTLAPHQYGRVF
jgi:hypothetical protein